MSGPPPAELLGLAVVWLGLKFQANRSVSQQSQQQTTTKARARVNIQIILNLTLEASKQNNNIINPQQ
jgi:hypothetical protein